MGDSCCSELCWLVEGLLVGVGIVASGAACEGAIRLQLLLRRCGRHAAVRVASVPKRALFQGVQ